MEIFAFLVIDGFLSLTNIVLRLKTLPKKLWQKTLYIVVTWANLLVMMNIEQTLSGLLPRTRTHTRARTHRLCVFKNSVSDFLISKLVIPKLSSLGVKILL